METKVISGIQFSSLPSSYIRPESERPKLSEVAECNNVPVIDLACEDKSLMVKQIGDACQEYGFFQVINHGVSKERVDKILEVAHEFFSLPVEEKMKLYSDDPSKTMRLSTSFNVKETVHNWRDYLRLHCYPLEKYVPEWPSNPSSFKDFVSTYCMEVRQLGFRLQEAISESLGLDKDSLKNVLGEQGQHMAVNYYPACPEPDLTFGLPAHTDPNALIILLQDLQVSGLQVLKDGKWLAIKPQPDAFVINIGDQLQYSVMEVREARKGEVFDQLGGRHVKNQLGAKLVPNKVSRLGTKLVPNDVAAQVTWWTACGRTDQEMAIASIGSDSGAQDQPKVLTAVRAGHEKSNVRKALPKQCKYWVTGNCVHGDKCKNLHSWFCGSGFTMLAKLEGHTKAITGISLPSGCDKLYSGGKDGTVRAWDCNNGQCAGSAMIDSEVGCLVAEGPWLLVGFRNAVKAWNLQNHAEFSLNGPAGLVCSMVVDNDKLFAGIEDGTILVWKWHPETNIPEPAAMLKDHNGAVCSLIIGANRLYSGSRDCTIKVWDPQNLQCLQTLYGHTRDVMSVLCWDSYLISASLDNTLKVWAATESGTIEVVYEVKEDYGVIALCGIHDAEARPILLCSLNDKTVRLYDLPSFSERGRIFSKQKVQVIQIGINGLFFTGDATGEVSVWKLLGVPCATAS